SDLVTSASFPHRTAKKQLRRRPRAEIFPAHNARANNIDSHLQQAPAWRFLAFIIQIKNETQDRHAAKMCAFSSATGAARYA
ncbi:UNVERIFIED_CONTAM: hypothetical protein RF648_20215, partial [Kocuria sp. CPCC 205274]